MFIDKVTINVASGKGGNGAVTYRREKFVAYGGPDGGDGGHGGSVYLEASDDLQTLLDFQFHSIFKAEDGEKGSRGNCNGKAGKDITIKVPCGTVVRDIKAGLTIADLKYSGDKVLLAEGGRGGRGNVKFKSQKNKAPHYAEPGEPSIERELQLELKTIADVGLIGFPNAGKSSLISKLSSAKPKIADYAFTTLSPNLGVIKREEGKHIVIADIPGLIAGASEGHGLGYEFLRHIERTRFFVHVVDAWGYMGSNVSEEDANLYSDPLIVFQKVNEELESYSEELAQRPQIIVLNKIEAYPEEDLEKLKEQFQKAIQGKTNFIGICATSCVDNIGIHELKNLISSSYESGEFEQSEIELDEDTIATNHDDDKFFIEKQIRKQRLNENIANPLVTEWIVHCGKLERIMKITDLREVESLHHLFRVTRSLGVFDALKEAGAAEGDILNIDGVEFDITDVLLNASATRS